VATQRMDGHHGNVSQAQATESHSQTRKVSACPVLKQGSDRGNLRHILL